MSIEIQEHTFDTGLVTLNYAEGPPSGSPLVLLHGGSNRWQSLEAMIPELAARWHLYAPDFRGHGKSGWVPQSYRLQDYADDIIAFLRRRVAEPACLFGHSLGGGVALLVAAQCPDYVQGVAVGDSPLDGETSCGHIRRTRDKIAAWRELAGGQRSLAEVIEILKGSPVEVPGQDTLAPMREVMGEDSPVFEWLAINLYHNDPDMLGMLLDNCDTYVAGYEMETVLPAIQCPVLLLQADPTRGGLMTEAEVERALPLLAQPSHVRLEQVSHVLHITRKEPVLQAIVEFLETL